MRKRDRVTHHPDKLRKAEKMGPIPDGAGPVFSFVIKDEPPAYRADAGRTSYESALVGEEHHRDTP